MFRVSSVAFRPIFQSTLPRGERPSFSNRNTPFTYFNPRSREGSDVTVIVACAIPDYFNPRSREGSDSIITAIVQYIAISIHAPARGATPALTQSTRWQTISIHAPARGATSGLCTDSGSNHNFNPRSREGSD